MKIVIIDYGAGNVYSVQSAIRRLGYETVVSTAAAVIRTADRVIFPGVGQASAAMEKIRGNGLDILLPQLEMPVLGICLGMQLMCSYTEEEDTPGLGIFPVRVKKFSGIKKVPHMGWNTIEGLKTALFEDIAEGERMYFVHSYAVPENEYCIARCDYGESFSAAVARNNFYGCQFHPEKSSRAGEKILRNFINQ